MPFAAKLIAVLVTSYLLGCLVAAYYITRWRLGVDIRASGSGNAGARNMGRVYGPYYALLTGVLDALKGILAVLGGLYFVGPEWVAVAALLAAIIGHIWPVQLSFHGGKGVATALGGLIALDPLATLALLGVGVLTYGVTKNFYRSGLFAIGLGAPMLWVFNHDMPTVIVAAAASALCLAVHHPALDAPRQPRPAETQK